MIRRLLALLLALAAAPALACDGPATVCATVSPGALALIGDGRVATVIVDDADDPAVRRAAGDLRGDLSLVGGATPRADLAVIVGSLGHSPVIDRLAREGRLDTAAVAGRWEAFAWQVVDHPTPGINRALVIAGADPRGAIYGAYELSRRIGVSPWHWWADVPVSRRPALWLTAGRRTDAPAVKYRGIFLNDEDPALKGWATATFGGFNHRFYGRLFELMLRLRANLLWPAMWGKAFYDDDLANAATARHYGVVIGTSHHEPLMRAHVEWERHGRGPWDYTKNAERLRAFWREGMARAPETERIVTVGMRGDGDEPMTRGTAIPLLERIVADQRAIIADVTKKPAAETPQVWALYKEVQDYYDRGMRVPEDVTLLFSDDNWGNIRRLPKAGETRPGGYGVYYHFDYVGGPRNYKWINTTQIARVWEQLRLARAHGADRLWIVNVGDLKPMELPTSFFLDLAWNPEAITPERLAAYHRDWAAEQFGAAQAGEIGAQLDRVTRLLARRKPELIAPETWSITGEREADTVLAEHGALEVEARRTAEALPADARDAYYQLVLHPIEASANLARLNVAVARNRLHAGQGRADTNALADEAARLFAEDRAIARRYEAIAGGKWIHMMDQTHIGYTGWQQPPADVMPEVRRIALPTRAEPGVAIDEALWAGDPIRLERFGAAERRVELFARDARPLRVTPAAPRWVRLRQCGDGAGRGCFLLSIDWRRAPAGESRTRLRLGRGFAPELALANHPDPAEAGFVEAAGRTVIDATHFGRRSEGPGTTWQAVPGLGLHGAAITPLPQAPVSATPGKGAWVEYDVVLAAPGAITLSLLASPSLDVAGGRGLRYAVALDDQAPQVVDLLAGEDQQAWERSVIRNIRIGTSIHPVAAAGHHRIRLWMVDPGVVAQRLVLTRAGVETGLLAPESARVAKR